MKILTRMKDFLKQAFEIMRADEGLEKRVRNYVDVFYEFCYEESYLSSGESVPYYFYWSEYARRIFCVLSLFIVGIVCTLIYSAFAVDGKTAVILLTVLLVIYLFIALMHCIPVYYWSKKREFKKVRVIRLNTRKAIAQFEHDYERAVALAKPYREQREKEEAERKAAEEERQRLKAEAKAQEAEELRDTFRPQYMALLQYVETYYKVSTPDPELRPTIRSQLRIRTSTRATSRLFCRM